MKCKLTKVSRPDGVDGGLRTTTVEGWCEEGAIAIGKTFRMTAPPLECGDIRFIETSPVRAFELMDSVFTILTHTGSVYKVEIQGE